MKPAFLPLAFALVATATTVPAQETGRVYSP